MRFLRGLVFWVLLESCACVNDEGRALLKFRESVKLDPFGALLDWDGDAADPCLWFGVGCSDGKVVSLNLKDLRLEGTVTPELGKLIYIKFLALSGNKLVGSIPPELNGLNIFSELEDCDDPLYSERGCITRNVGNSPARKLLQVGGEDRIWHHRNQIRKEKPHSLSTRAPSPSHVSFNLAPIGSPSLSPFHSRAFSPSPLASPPFLPPSPSIELSTPIPTPSPTIEPSITFVKPKLPIEPPSVSVLFSGDSNQGKRIKSWIIYVPIIVGVSVLLALSALYMLCCKPNNVVTVRPWATGLSGQLQKAFVTGVPSLKRSELQIACEDFSNIIGSLSDRTLYKGTLSSGVEIAVISTELTSAKDWSKQSESHFRKKISELSRVNHKNFVNLLGYCAEQEPFTRMLVFEYAPNGTLFEHLHVKEAADLDWGARMRIAMGTAYCLEHMHQLDPPVTLKTLNSSTILLTDDYASKVVDINIWDDDSETQPEPESIVYKFGILMLEIISGRTPFEESGNPQSWLSSYLNGKLLTKEIIDPALGSLREDVGALLEVISSCINPTVDDRPTMAEVALRLKNITSMSPDRATPSVSPLWWAEIEIASEAN